MSKRRTPYVSVNLTVDARNAVQRAALDYSAKVGRRLAMSSIVVAALEVANRHPDELTAALTEPDSREKDQ